MNKLTPKHYAIIAGLLVLLGIIVSIPFIIKSVNPSKAISTGIITAVPITDLFLEPTTLQTALYEQKNPDNYGFKVEIQNTTKIGGIANIYAVETDCGQKNLTFTNSNSYSIAVRVLYSGSAVINGKIVHTFASVEKTSYIPSLGIFNCDRSFSSDPIKNQSALNNYRREVYNTLLITELDDFNSASYEPGYPQKIQIDFRRQKLRKEYTYLGGSNIHTPFTKFSEPSTSNGNKMIVIDDSKNVHDTQISYKIKDIILRRTNKTGIL